MLSDGAASREAVADQAGSLAIPGFRRAVVELGLLDAEAFDRVASDFAADLTGLTRSLSRSGLVTAYQSAAICQGKVRGLVVGDYLILDKLGEGGMGVVFKARHRRLGHKVALKILRPRLARDRKLVLRFRREIHATALVDHPNIVAVLDADEDRGVHYLTMQYIEGIDLDGFVRNGGTLPVAQAVDCVMQAARGLAAAHARGIIHRDIKPGNLMLDTTGTIRVLDLGLALLSEGAGQLADTAAMTLTQAGAYMGTVDYMAPEQAQNSHTVDHRADIYSLACTLHFLLTGRPPFEGATPLSRLIAHQQMPAPSLRGKRPDVTLALDAVYQAMMAKQPDDRLGSMTDVLARLDTRLSPAVLTLPAPPALMTLPGPVHNSELASPEVAAASRNHLHDASGDSNGHAALNREGRGTDVGLAESVAPLPARAPTASASVHAAARTPRRVAILSSLGILAVLAAIATLIMLNRRDLDKRMMRGRAGADLTSNPTNEPDETQPFATERQPRAAVGNGLEPVVERPTPTPATVKNQRERPAIVASNSRPSAPPVDASRTPEKRPGPVPAQPPKIAGNPPPATYEAAPPCFRHKGAVTSIAVSLDGKLALSAGADHYARLWNIKTGDEISAARHPAEVFDAALSGDGRFAWTCTKAMPNTNGAVRFWNMGTFTPKVVFGSDRAHTGSINAVALFGDGRALSGGHDGRVVLWNLATGKRGRLIGQQKGSIHPHGVAFFPRGFRAATGGADGLVHIWNLGRGEEVATWEGHRGAISSIAISANGSRVATGGSDGTVILWEQSTGSVIRSFKMPDGDRNASVAILADGNVLAAGDMRGQLVVWDANSGLVLRQSRGPFVKHRGLAVMPDGQRVLTADQDGVVRMWLPRPR